MTAGLIVRPMRPEDVPSALEAVASHDAGLVREARAAFTEAITGEGWPRWMLVAERAGAVVGVMGYSRDRWGVDDVFWVEWVFVLPSARRRGVARTLYAEVERQLVERGCRKVYLDVGNADTHVTAIAFHRAQGFALEGTLSDYWADGEDFLVFGKRLAPRQPTSGPE